MANEQPRRKPQLGTAVLSGGESRYYVSLASARLLVENGCILCKVSFDNFEVLDVNYETSDLFVAGMSLPEVAELRLALIQNSPATSVSHGTAFLIDKKAAVCLKCFTEYLQQIIQIKKGASANG